MSSIPFELAGPTPKALVMLLLLTVAVPAAITAIALKTAGALDLAIGNTVLISVTVVSLVVFVTLAVAAVRKRIEIVPSGLSVRSSFYSVFVEKAAVRAAEIRTLDCKQDPTYALTLRTNGISMPGFQSGWFRTKGAGPAFVARNQSACVVVPTTKGFSLILGVGDTDAEAASRSLKELLA